MGKKSGPRGGKKGGKQGKGRSISKVKKTNIRHSKLAKKGKMKPPGSKPLYVEGGHIKDKKIAVAAKRKTLNKLELEKEAERRREYENDKKQMEDQALDEMADMIDPDDLHFLKQQASKKKSQYELLSNGHGAVKNGEPNLDDLEINALKRHSAVEDYKRTEEESQGRKRPLLPIRTKDGWQQRSGKAIASDSGDESDEMTNGFDDDGTGVEQETSDDEDEDNQIKYSKPVSIIDIVARRRMIIQKAKIQIGSMASNFVEAPEERVHVLEKLVKMVSEDISEVNELFKVNDENEEFESGDKIDLMPALHTVAKLAALSVCEILKDIIPNYKIIDTSAGHEKDLKLKKDTMRLQKYENAILTCTKNYLIKLERIVSNSRKNGNKKMYKGKQNLLINSQRYAISCTSELLKSHPYFNYMGDNVVNFLIPFLNANDSNIRTIVSSCVTHVFLTDKRGEVSYSIVKKINHHLKTKTHEKIQPDMLEVLLSIPLYSLNEAKQHRDNDMDNKKNKKGKNEPYVSKKERKRLKASAKLEKELLEAKGEESSKTKLRFATDITNVLFAIYFRLLKTITDRDFLKKKGSQRVFRILLRPLLSGLSKFGHLMSIEFFQDLLRTLTTLLSASNLAQGEEEKNNNEHKEDYRLLEKPLMGNFETLKCVETVFSILSGQGDQLTIDPSTFYAQLSRSVSNLGLFECQEVFTNLRESSLNGQNDTFALACNVLRLAYVRRRKKVTKNAVTDIWKRVGIAALQSDGLGAAKLLEFLRECGNTCPTLWSNYLNVDDDDEVGGECAASGIIGSATINNMTMCQGIPKTADEKFVSNVNGYHLWELSLLGSHVDMQVTGAVDSIFRTSVPTTVNASTNDTVRSSYPKLPHIDLTQPINVDAFPDCLTDLDEPLLDDNIDDEFQILSKDLLPMKSISKKRRHSSTKKIHT